MLRLSCSGCFAAQMLPASCCSLLHAITAMQLSYFLSTMKADIDRSSLGHVMVEIGQGHFPEAEGSQLARVAVFVPWSEIQTVQVRGL